MKLITLGLILISTMALADISAEKTGEQLYKKCVSCHGINGEKAALGKSSIINTWDKEQLVASMKGYLDGSYGGPMKALMKGQLMNYTNEEIELVADYIIEVNKK